MKMLESYHFFITLRFHDSGDQESYVSLHFTLTWVLGFLFQIKPATNLSLIAFRQQQMLYYVNFI